MRPPATHVGPRRTTPFVAALLLLLLASACSGGDGDGGGGGGDYVLRVLMVNYHSEAHTLSYSGGAPLASSPDEETAESCSAIIVHYPVTVPFELLVDGLPVIVSDELRNPVPEETDLVGTLDVLADGTAVPNEGHTPGSDAVVAGRNVSKPAAVGIC